MSSFNALRVKELLRQFRFAELFREELGWEAPHRTQAVPFDPEDPRRKATPIAELGGVYVLELVVETLPEASVRKSVHHRIGHSAPEHVLVFRDIDDRVACWSWLKREGGKEQLRDHYYYQGQPGDAFIAKIANLTVELSELDPQGRIPLRAAADKVRSALDVQKVVRRFYDRYKDVLEGFVDAIDGIDVPTDRRWYASVLLNRLMFIYFLQKGRFLDGGNLNYLEDKLALHREAYYDTFLAALFFEAFAKPRRDRSNRAIALCGEIPYLNGGLFHRHRLEANDRYSIRVPAEAFDRVLALLGDYEWTFDAVPERPDEEINPDVLGYIFEKYINQKEFGAYYTPIEITAYLVHETVEQLLLDKGRAVARGRSFETVYDMINRADATLLGEILKNALPSISLLDPACGSGAFLYAALRSMHDLYFAALGRVDALKDESLRAWKSEFERGHPSLGYAVDKRIITDNLYGVDIMEEATEIARLRLFMALVSNVSPGRVDDLEPLPNIDFNILPGNSLIGLTRVEDELFNSIGVAKGGLFGSSTGYRELLEAKNTLTNQYRRPTEGQDAATLRDEIDNLDALAKPRLSEMLVGKFPDFEQANWDVATGKEGKPTRRPFTGNDLEELEPFHWGYEFSEILSKRGGFDAIITNPPWETVKPQDKEFFARYSNEVRKNRMSIKDFEAHKNQALRDDPVLRREYEDYLSRFPHQSAYFRSAHAFAHQRAQVNGKWTGTDVNLYKLFTERCFQLLRPGGYAGMIVPTNLMKDLGAFGLRKMLFAGSRITGVVGLSNERFLFEGVDHRFNLCIISFRKSTGAADVTSSLSTVFRINPREAISRDHLSGFLADRDLRMTIPLDFVKRLSPDSWSLMEFRSPLDVQIAEKMLRFPALGEHIEGTWNLRLANEFHMTNDSHLFRTEPGPGRLPMWEGKLVNQFTGLVAPVKYWVNESQARASLGAKSSDEVLDYQRFRLAMRRIGRSSDSRTLIATILPPNTFAAESFHLAARESLSAREQLWLLAFLNSFCLDWAARQTVNANISMFLVSQLRVPRTRPTDPLVTEVAADVLRLLSVQPAFLKLAAEAGLGQVIAANEPQDRLEVRARLDAIVATVYGLSEQEFCGLMATFPLVTDAAKEATLAEFRLQAERNTARSIDPLYAELKEDLVNHEDLNLEFKATLTFPSAPVDQRIELKDQVLREIVALLNAKGGRIYIGVHDRTREILGIEKDFPAIGARGWDAFERHLNSLIEPCRFAPVPVSRYRVRPIATPHGTVCRIDVDAAPDEIWHYRDLIVVRQDGSVRELRGYEGTTWADKRRRGLV